MTKIANEVVLDHTTGKVFIDGIEFPFFIEPEAEVEVLDGVAVVRISVYADNVRLVGDDGATRAARRAPLSDELAWAAERGREIVRDGLADVIAQLRVPA